MDCKKCGNPLSRIWVNKRQQRMGKCTAAGCGKMVYLGKAEKPAEAAAGEQKEAPRAKARSKKTTKPRAAAAAAAGPGSGEQQPSPRTFFERVTEFLDREW